MVKASENKKVDHISREIGIMEFYKD